jgi:hypothetical protein
MKEPKHPMQPIVLVKDIIRFKENKLVRMLLDHSSKTGLDLNKLAAMTYSKNEYKDDWNQLAQLIGYSTSGFGDLDYAYKDLVKEADKIAEEMYQKKRIRKGKVNE